jgi:2-amino-4-hydroxy-6-hydroxymethyldihydropteridine diphosphokinase
MPESVDIYIGLGSNQGNREQLIEKAIELLSVALGAPIQQSTIIETEPWGFESDFPFLNMVACFNCNLQPLELLDLTEKTEKELGRTTKSSGGIYKDRPIDIDILLYGNRVIESERLTIPHPRLHERHFVLEPLKEISPQLVHPILKKTIAELTDSIKTDGKVY